MKKISFLAAILLAVFFIPKISFANIVINEVYYDPTGTDTGSEHIILYNNDNSDIDLTGWDLDPSSAPYYTFPSFMFKAKSFVIIHINTSGTNSDTDLYDSGSSNMSNTKGPIALFNSTIHSSSTIIDYIEYGEGGQTNESKAVSAGIWTAGDFIPDADSGKAIKLKTDGIDNNLSSDWSSYSPSVVPDDETEESETPAENELETPSSATGNQPPIPDAGDNIIGFIGQEINFDGSKSIDPEGSELACSWNMGDGKLIEEKTFSYKYTYPGTYLVTLMVYDGRYYVSDTITVKIQSQEISINEFIPNPEGDDKENEWIEVYNNSDSIVDISGWQLDDEEEGSKPFVFPQNTLIAPKSYIVFPRPVTKIALNNDGDSVRLLLPEGIVFQEIQYNKAEQGRSSSNTPEGFIWSEPTPGMANISYPEAVGGINRETAFQYQVEPETTKEPGSEYSWRLTEIPDKEIEGGYSAQSDEMEATKNAEKQLAIIPSEAQVAQIIETEKETTSSETANLILMLAAVFLGALIIGIFITKFKRKKEAL